MASGATSIDRPWDFKDVLTFRLETAGRERALVGVPRRLYDRLVANQTSTSEVVGYDLATPNKINISPPAAGAGVLRLRYYRRMTLPCTIAASSNFILVLSTNLINVGAAPGSGNLINSLTIGSRISGTGASDLAAGETDYGISKPIVISIIDDLVGGTPGQINIRSNWDCQAGGLRSLGFGGDNELLDLHEDHELGILSWATQHFLFNTGAPLNRVAEFKQLAETELRRSIVENDEQEDVDVAFSLGPFEPYYNPNATIV